MRPVAKVSRAQTFLEGLWNEVFSRYSLWLETLVYQRMGAVPKTTAKAGRFLNWRSATVSQQLDRVG